MLVEISVRNLGVIECAVAQLGPGMTAITGETGAGKTLVVTAIALLCGGRADPSLVRAGAQEAEIQGRFILPIGSADVAGEAVRGGSADESQEPGEDGFEEVIVRRVIPSAGRSRAYLAGRLCTAQELSQWASGVVDIHGQHEHQSLLATAAQRDALDDYAGVDTSGLLAARSALRDLRAELDRLGGDEQNRARTADLLRYQIDEIESVGIEDPDEDERLRLEEELLASVVQDLEAAAVAEDRLTGEGGAADLVGEAIAAARFQLPLGAIAARLEGILAELRDSAAELRTFRETSIEDPQRLAFLRERRNSFHKLTRKYGRDLGEVLQRRDAFALELAEVEGKDQRASALADEIEAAETRLRDVEAEVGNQRRSAAGELAPVVTARLRELAMPGATLDVRVGPASGDEVEILIAANSGQPAASISKAASGGELARVMLALRLVLTAGPSVLIFDEVDAGVGGAAAKAVAGALASVAHNHQVLVVTHLAQVAAVADRHLVVSKLDDGASTTTVVEDVTGPDRVAEIARMIAGDADAEVAKAHARSLLGIGDESAGAGSVRSAKREVTRRRASARR